MPVAFDSERALVRVMIAGAGLGGLMLAVLLERAGVKYKVYEQNERYVPIGSAIALGPQLLPMFEQIGLLPEIYLKSKPVEQVEGYTEKMNLFMVVPYHYTMEFSGYYTRVIAHTDLYKILCDNVPEHKIMWGKKIIRVQENPADVTVLCEDGSQFMGEILVGADGAHSNVRKSIFKSLNDAGILPKSDKSRIRCTGVCLLGQTKPLDSGIFLNLNDEFSTIKAVYGETYAYRWSIVTTHQNTICWAVIVFFNKNPQTIEDLENLKFWNSQPSGEMCENLKHLPIPCGENLTLGDLIGETSREFLCKVMHEEKFFETWFSRRTVLIGDACHKMSIADGLGTVHAFRDAVVLANYINAIPCTSPWTDEQIAGIFQNYKEERYQHAKYAYDYGHNLGRLMGKNWITEISRTIAGKTPNWLWKIILRRIVADKLQVNFLPRGRSNSSVLSNSTTLQGSIF